MTRRARRGVISSTLAISHGPTYTLRKGGYMKNDSNRLRTCYFRPYLPGKGPSFRLRTFDRGIYRNGRNQTSYALEMKVGPKYIVLFTGDDFGHSPMDAIDSDGAIAGLMSFLTLRPGDTDSEYFDAYTPGQLAYCEQHAEALAMEVYARFGER